MDKNRKRALFSKRKVAEQSRQRRYGCGEFLCVIAEVKVNDKRLKTSLLPSR